VRYVYRGHEFDAANDDDAHEMMRILDGTIREQETKLSWWERAISSGQSEDSQFLPASKQQRKGQARQLLVGIVVIAAILIALFLLAYSRGDCKYTNEGCEIQTE
jgi:hypothetical protein